MELKQIKELMSAMGRTGMKKLMVKDGDFELQLEKESDETVRILDSSRDYSDDDFGSGERLIRRADLAFSKGGSASTTPPGSMKGNHGGDHSDQEGSSRDEDEGAKVQFVKSPMVGTFYLSSSPDEQPFVKVGDKIEKDTVVCIIEAMKVMNEIKAGVSGVVKEALVVNSHPVEFGTPLFKIV